MADEGKAQEPQGAQQQGAEPPQEPQGTGNGAEPQAQQDRGAEPPVVDSHGQPGINKERHDKEIAELQAKIDELQAQAAEAAEQKEKRADFEKQVADLKSELEGAKASLADEKVNHSLEMAGCLNVKMAKAVLEEYGGDVSKLKDACPYLFQSNQKGSTGLPPAGAPTDDAGLVAKAREAAGTARYYQTR